MPSYAPDYKPRLRSGLQASPSGEPGRLMLHDSRRLTPQVMVIHQPALPLLQAFNGQRTIGELSQLVGNSPQAIAAVTRLVEGLDEALMLDSQHFADYVAGPHRLPSCIGCYAEDPKQIRVQLTGLFTGPGGPGLPKVRTEPGQLRAVFVPHMDYARGGVTYGWGFKELVEQSNAKLYFIIATSHYSPERFTLTRKNFQTPLGVVPTDQMACDVLESVCGPSLFNDPLAHLPEHSIELEVLLLQFLLEGKRPFRILPLLCGSLRDCVQEKRLPNTANDVRKLVKALQQAEAEANEEVCYIISGDLAHIGPKFHDSIELNDERLAASEVHDRQLLDCFRRADAAGFFNVIANEQDNRNICGLPPAWAALQASQATRGKVLHYGRFVHPDRFESVSFASAAFY